MGATETRSLIASAAAAEFLQRGYAGTSLSAIAERMNLTKGALTYHFPAKTDFADHFRIVLRSHTLQAKHYAEAAFPECPTRKLLYFFLILGSWKQHSTQFRASLKMVNDTTLPSCLSDEAVPVWKELCDEAVGVWHHDSNTNSVTETATLVLLSLLGSTFFSHHFPSNDSHLIEFQTTQFALSALGVDPQRLTAYCNDVQNVLQREQPSHQWDEAVTCQVPDVHQVS